MNIQMMEGLVGASASIKLSGAPMSVYRQASAEGNEEKMKRALGYSLGGKPLSKNAGRSASRRKRTRRTALPGQPTSSRSATRQKRR